MEEIYASVVAYRGIERLMIVGAALIFAFMGYKLFVYGVDTGNGKLETESAFFKLTFSGSGPGLFFMAFGGLILMYSVFSNVSLDREALVATTQQSAEQTSPSTPAQTRVKETLKFSNGGKGACDDIRLSAHNSAADALWVYQNALAEQHPAKKNLESLAGNLEKLALNEETLASLLTDLEEVICILE